MKLLAAIAALLVVAASSASTAETAASSAAIAMPSERTLARLHAVSPTLEKYTKDSLLGDVWKRPDLSTRDRAIVTLAVLIAPNQTTDMPYYVNLALDNGVKPSSGLTKPQLAEVLTHVAFYAGWPNAFSAAAIAKDVLERRTTNASIQTPSVGRDWK